MPERISDACERITADPVAALNRLPLVKAMLRLTEEQCPPL